MGNHFIPGPVVASYTDKYPESELGQFGFFATTNIVHQGPFYYAIFFQSPPRDQGLSGGMTQSGNCLFRTNNFLNPESWRGWNGAGFTYNPNKGRAQCTLVAPAGTDIFRSIAYVPKLGQWIATTAGRHRMPGDSQPVPGFYTLTSTDLLHWGGLTRIMPVPMAPRTDSMDSVYSYPSLIDPDSTSRNFETLDHDSAILVFSVHHLRNGAGTRNRDLQYVGVRIR
jgi:hypothetical protein